LRQIAYHSRTGVSKRNKTKQAQLLKFTTAAVQSSGFEVIDDTTEKDEEVR
jgi:hypothetical protein